MGFFSTGYRVSKIQTTRKNYTRSNSYILSYKLAPYFFLLVLLRKTLCGTVAVMELELHATRGSILKLPC